MKNSDTRECILDVCERLFAEKGVRETSLRAITGAAGVNIASVNYHFGSKKGLVEAVLKRRLDPLNSERIRRLEYIRKEAELKGTRPSVREIMRAIFEPILLFKENTEHSENFLRFIARSMTDPDETVKTIFLREIRPVFELMFELLKKACPNTPDDVLFWKIQFSLGAMGHSLWGFRRLKMVPEGIDTDITSDKLLDLWLDFVTAGIENDI